MIHFKKWLVENSNQDFAHHHDNIEDAIAESIFRAVNNAMREWFHGDKIGDLFKIMEDKFKGHAKKTNFGSEALPEWGIKINLPSKIKNFDMPFKDAQVRIKLSPKDEMAYMGGTVITAHMNQKIIDKAKSFSDPDLQQLLLKLQYQLHHESTHLSSAKNIEANKEHNSPYLQSNKKHPKYDDYKVTYFTSNDELRSHAKQFAVLYDKFFPKQKFELEKMLSLKPFMPAKIERFFQGFDETGNSAIWNMNTDKYQKQFKEAKEKIIPLVQHYLKLIQDRKF